MLWFQNIFTMEFYRGIKYLFTYISFVNLSFITQFTYIMVHSYGPQIMQHYKGIALYMFISFVHLNHEISLL